MLTIVVFMTWFSGFHTIGHSMFLCCPVPKPFQSIKQVLLRVMIYSSNHMGRTEKQDTGESESDIKKSAPQRLLAIN